MNERIDSNVSQRIPGWGSEEAVRKESHVARFLEREYRAALERGWTLEALGISTTSGPTWEETPELIETHYDERPEFFDSFLDRRFRAYTMAYYGEDAAAVKASGRTLEEAQEAKYDLICERAGIRGDEKILDIGCGFGAFERYLLSRYPDIEVIGITPSAVQYRHLQAALAKPETSGLDPRRFRVLPLDFDRLTDSEIAPGSLDLVISIGVLEQVLNMAALNRRIARFLKPGGRSFHHFIVSRMVIPQFLDASKTLIGDYFPGGRIWPFDEFSRHEDDLTCIGRWFVNGMNYWRTLDEWHRRFSANLERLAAHLDLERLRYWNDYFILCKACFLPADGALYGNGHYLFQKSS